MDPFDPDDFGLPITPDMLDLDGPDPFKVTHIDGETGLRVATKYFDIAIHRSGDTNSQLELDSRPAFEVAMLHLVDGGPNVVLIQKTRQEQAGFRDISTITKVPGGYFHDGTGGNMEFVVKRILQETGYQLDPENVRFFGAVIGHTEIRTPIALGYATRFKLIQNPREGITVVDEPLSYALELAENAVRQRQPFLENDTAFEGLMVIDRMLQRGEIVL